MTLSLGNISIRKEFLLRSTFCVYQKADSSSQTPLIHQQQQQKPEKVQFHAIYSDKIAKCICSTLNFTEFH